MSILDVHLHGERIGTLFLAGEDDYRFTYDRESVKRGEPGAPLLSAALPLRPEPYGAEPSRAYVEGLLPEGARRIRLAAALGIDPADGWSMIAAIGRECAGAVSFGPQGKGPERGTPDDHAWLDEEELEALLAPHRGLKPHAPEAVTRAALAGERDKLALVRDPIRGRWGLPGPGRPSTHVIKPESGEFPGLAANEAFCQALAARAGLPAAKASCEQIGGRPCLVSPRFDRDPEGGGAIHQEDFCQALGFAPAADVAAGRAPEEDAEGPGFAEACGLLGAFGARDALPVLLGTAVFNYTVGNGDAHGRNFALLYEPDRTSLAPLHDLTSTAVYDLPTYTGMVLAEDYDETAYLFELNLAAEECGIDLDVFRALAAETAARIRTEIEPLAEQARAEGWHEPAIDQIVELASERARCLGYEVEF